MDPLVYGSYPISMRELVKERLPKFTPEEKKMMKGSFDFIGVNYYTSRYAKSMPRDPNALPISFTHDSFTNITGIIINKSQIYTYFWSMQINLLIKLILAYVLFGAAEKDGHLIGPKVRK